MMCRFASLVVLTIFCSISSIQAQPCIPDPVETISLLNNSLTWSASENCPNTDYTVIIETGGIIEYEYTLNALSLNISFLKLCTNYTFTVSPTADHILGQEAKLHTSIALPSGVNITIHNFTAAQVGEDLLIEWLVNETYSNCVAYYHLLTWDEDSVNPESLDIDQTGHLIENVAQCMNYSFEITPYYNQTNGTVQKFNFTVPQEPNTPSLVELRRGLTTINTTWSLEKYSLNRCNVTALYINSTHFNETYHIVDARDRPDVVTTIGALRANSMYYFNVTTLNSAGLSKPVQIAVQTLPEETNL